MPRAVRAATLVAGTERRRRCPCGRDEFGDRQPRREDLALECRDVRGVRRPHPSRPGSGPARAASSCRHERAEVALDRAHVAVRQLEPRPREGVRELVRVLQEAPRDRLVDRVDAQREVGGQHRRRPHQRAVLGVGHGVRAAAVLRLPLVGAGRALRQLPLVAEEVLEVGVVPGGRGGVPGDLEAAGDRVAAVAAAEALLPAQALLLERGALGLRADVLLGVGRTVGLAEGVAAGDERDGLLVVHRHPAERLADVAGRGERVGVRVRALGVDVDQPHLDRGQRVLQLAVAGVALVAAEPGLLGAPVDVLVGLPDVGAAAGEAEGLKAHRFQRAVAGEDDEVGPGQCAAVLLLDRPEQPAGLVQVAVVRPAVQRGEALHAGARAAAAVAGCGRCRRCARPSG